MSTNSKKQVNTTKEELPIVDRPSARLHHASAQKRGNKRHDIVPPAEESECKRSNTYNYKRENPQPPYQNIFSKNLERNKVEAD